MTLEEVAGNRIRYDTSSHAKPLASNGKAARMNPQFRG